MTIDLFIVLMTVCGVMAYGFLSLSCKIDDLKTEIRKFKQEKE